MRNHRNERLCDGIALRTTPSQRRFIEQLSEKQGVDISEGIRMLIDEAMRTAGAC